MGLLNFRFPSETWFIWVYLLIVSSLVTGLTRSPYVALSTLICGAFLVRWTLGVRKISWAFFVITILFIGGIIVMFMYITRLISSSKVSWGKLKAWTRGLLILALVGIKLFFNPLALGKLWAGGVMEFTSLALVVYLILFLLVRLLVVCNLSQKHMGPIKSYLKK